jgi:hypothetical protein
MTGGLPRGSRPLSAGGPRWATRPHLLQAQLVEHRPAGRRTHPPGVMEREWPGGGPILLGATGPATHDQPRRWLRPQPHLPIDRRHPGASASILRERPYRRVPCRGHSRPDPPGRRRLICPIPEMWRHRGTSPTDAERRRLLRADGQVKQRGGVAVRRMTGCTELFRLVSLWRTGRCTSSVGVRPHVRSGLRTRTRLCPRSRRRPRPPHLSGGLTLSGRTPRNSCVRVSSLAGLPRRRRRAALGRVGSTRPLTTSEMYDALVQGRRNGQGSRRLVPVDVQRSPPACRQGRATSASSGVNRCTHR